MSDRSSTRRFCPTEAGHGEHGSFTGAFAGMAAFDTSGGAIAADYGYFLYEGRD
jgi:xylan 1,4-beta-xylosidase